MAGLQTDKWLAEYWSRAEFPGKAEFCVSRGWGEKRKIRSSPGIGEGHISHLEMI